MGKKKDLGKGIRALLADIESQQPEEKGSSIKQLSKATQFVPMEDIEVNPYQPRDVFESSAIQDLATSIKTFGIIQPLTVRSLGDGKFQIISGERRFRAAKLAGLKEIPAFIRIADDQGMLEMALVENIQRQDLNALEVGLSFQRLIAECKLTQEELSGRVGKNRSTISNYIRLLKLPPEIQDGIRNQDISMGHARALVGVEDPVIQLNLYRKVKIEKLSVRQLEQLIKNQSTRSIVQVPKAKNIYISDLETKVSERLNTRVKIQQNDSGNGKIIIAFDDNAELAEFIDKIG